MQWKVYFSTAFYKKKKKKKKNAKSICIQVIVNTSTKYALIISFVALRKHAYSNILKISPPKTESFQIKTLIFFIDCRYSLESPRWGDSNEYPQSMFLSRN